MMETSPLNSAPNLSTEMAKLFVGRINESLNEEEMGNYFAKFGEVKDVVVVKDKVTGSVRGFGFVEFLHPDSAERALNEKEHAIGDQTVEVKRARPRGERWNHQSPQYQYTIHSDQESRGLTSNVTNNDWNNENPAKLKKIFVGGLPPSITDDEFRSYFEQFGNITDVATGPNPTPIYTALVPFIPSNLNNFVSQVSHADQMHHPLAEAFLAAPATAKPDEPAAAAAATAEQLKCPRCESPNTKFCYYNNYNLSQPRHFCKSCRRYWTKGGALRNVPVGGGSRKNPKRSSSPPPPSANPPKRPAPDPAPAPAPAPASAIFPAAARIDPDDKMLEITGSFSSLLQSTCQFGDLNFLDGFDSGGSGAAESDSGDPKSAVNPDPNPQQQPPAENLLWSSSWPDLVIYSSPGSSFQ